MKVKLRYQTASESSFLSNGPTVYNLDGSIHILSPQFLLRALKDDSRTESCF